MNTNTFVLFLDILGFSDLVKANSMENLKAITNSFWDGFNRAIDESRTIDEGGSVPWKISLKDLEFRLISDSIFIWAKHDSFNNFRNLLEATSSLLSYGLKNGFPLRGAINYGELITSSFPNGPFFNNENVYGKSLVDAVQIEKNQDWSGCLVTPEAWKRVCESWALPNNDDPNSFFYFFPHLVWYQVPLKKGSKNAIAVNWTYETKWDEKTILSPDCIVKSFKQYREGANDNKKVEETMKFLDASTELQNRIPCDDPRKEGFPVPNDQYIQLDNKYLTS